VPQLPSVVAASNCLAVDQSCRISVLLSFLEKVTISNSLHNGLEIESLFFLLFRISEHICDLLREFMSFDINSTQMGSANQNFWKTSNGAMNGFLLGRNGNVVDHKEEFWEIRLNFVGDELANVRESRRLVDLNLIYDWFFAL
jgi:hypothetical protein